MLSYSGPAKHMTNLSGFLLIKRCSPYINGPNFWPQSLQLLLMLTSISYLTSILTYSYYLKQNDNTFYKRLCIFKSVKNVESRTYVMLYNIAQLQAQDINGRPACCLFKSNL